MKTCTKCGTEKAISEFSKDSSKKDGLQANCKICKSAATKAWNVANPDKQKAYSSARYAANKEEDNARCAAWRAANPGYSAAWRKDNPERARAHTSAWHKANPDAVSALQRNRRARMRNADGSHTTNDITRLFELQRGLCACCAVKLVKSGKNKYHVDHILPLVRGGSNSPENLQLLCPSCNLRKNAKDPIDWAKENGKLL